MPDPDSDMIPVNVTAVDKCEQKGETMTKMVNLTDTQPVVDCMKDTTSESFTDTTIPLGSSKAG